jgi:Ca2+/Na+ antiporter
MAEGCEFLLDVYGPGVIGGILIPILGAVPDSLMILMSGLGAIETVQEELDVGVGTLAGSTIMLLTIPYSVGLYLNRRVVGGRDGRAQMRERKITRKVLNKVTGAIETKRVSVLLPVVPKKFSWTRVGATSLNTTPKGAVVMILSSLTYLIIQIPALFYAGDADRGAARESKFALFGFIVAGVSFLAYLWWTYNDGDAIEVVREKQRRLEETWATVDAYSNILQLLKGADPFTDAELLFDLFDHDKNGEIDFAEMKRGWEAIGYAFDDDQARMSFNLVDVDHTGTVNRAEFVNWIEDYLLPQYLAAQPAAAADEAAATARVPTALPAAARKQLAAFLDDPAAETVTLTLDQSARYLIHAWAASFVGPAFSLQTHAHDASAQALADAIRDTSPTLTATAVAAARQGKSGHPRHIDVTKTAVGAGGAAHKPRRQPLLAGVPAWACASDKLTDYFHNHTSASATALKSSYATLSEQDEAVYDELFAATLGGATALVTLDDFAHFATRFGLALTRTQVKFLFYSYDSDVDLKLTKQEVKLLLQNLVEPPSVSHHQSPLHAAAGAAAAGAAASMGKDAMDANAPLLSPLGSSPSGEGASLNSGSGSGYSAVDVADDEDGAGAGSDDEDEDEDEGGGGHHAMTEAQKIRWAIVYIGLGTAFVSIFADPMVDVIGCVGDKIGVPAFYISFIVTPLASNASEVIASIKFAAKKSDLNMGLTLSSLYGAATMNNTFCLCVFLGIIFFRGLAWTYTAEVTGTLFVTLIVGWIGLRQTIKMWQAAIVFALFPLSVLLIFGLNKLGVK